MFTLGALIYHFRRIFHDWSDEISLAILRNTIPAMGPRSRILIVETVVPERETPPYIALQDINMLCFGGMERTRCQWENLLKRAGLKVKWIWASDRNLQSTIEAVLRA